jgi:8-oxo-dGTP diphosphatase
MKHIEVAAAIIIKDKKIFCAQRKDFGETAKKWEFPGGKIEAGETPEQALLREIREELNTEIKIDRFFMAVNHHYNSFYLTMHTFLCSVVTGNLELREHISSKWLPFNELYTLDWCPADDEILKRLVTDFS